MSDNETEEKAETIAKIVEPLTDLIMQYLAIFGRTLDDDLDFVLCLQSKKGKKAFATSLGMQDAMKLLRLNLSVLLANSAEINKEIGEFMDQLARAEAAEHGRDGH